MKNSKYIIGILLAGLLIAQWVLHQKEIPATSPATGSSSQSEKVIESQSHAINDNTGLQEAFDKRKSNLWLAGSGDVIKILSDDNKGSRHQRFLVKVNFMQTVLIAHNIDLAERVADLKVGDRVDFYGEYEWNEKGGVIHWTHHDPSGKQTGGWIKHNNITYQ